jgi:pyruvate dehydrogenase E1 component beta subunit
MLFAEEGEVPDEAYTIEFGKARVVCEGNDVTVVGIGRMALLAEKAAIILSKEGISVEVIDPRTLSPFDMDTVLDSIEKTGRLAVVDESTPICSYASEIASIAASEAFSSLRAPICKITAPHTPVPAAPNLEAAYVPSVERIVAEVRKISNYKSKI